MTKAEIIEELFAAMADLETAQKRVRRAANRLDALVDQERGQGQAFSCLTKPRKNVLRGDSA